MAKKQLRNVRFDSNRVRLKTGETEKTNGGLLQTTANSQSWRITEYSA